MTIYAKCTNPKVDCLTDGKLYEVTNERDYVFDIRADSGQPCTFRWGGFENIPATWTRIEESEPPLWALDKAAKAADCDSWRRVLTNEPIADRTFISVKAHAATLAKYETEPVDPVKQVDRDKLADAFDAFGYNITAHKIREGSCDDDTRAFIDTYEGTKP